MRLITRHLPRSTTEIADIWRLGRARIAAAANQIWWTLLPPSLLENLVVRRLVASSDGRDHRTPPFFAVQRPHPLMQIAQIWNARSSCINLPTGPRAIAIVTSISVVQPSDNVRCPIIDWLLYICTQYKEAPTAPSCKAK